MTENNGRVYILQSVQESFSESGHQGMSWKYKGTSLLEKEWSRLKNKNIQPSNTGEFILCSVRKPMSLK